MQSITSVEIALGVFKHTPYVNTVWVKGSEFHINKPKSKDWEEFNRDSIENQIVKTKK